MFPSPAHSLRLLITSCLATFCLLGQAQTEIPPHKAILNSDLKNTLGTQVSDEVIDYLKVTSRGSRDCVVNTIQYGLFGVTIDSYSSRKLGACDPIAYRQLTEASIKAQMNTFDKVRQVVKGGFHTLVASRDLNPFISPYIFLGEIRFQKHARIEVNYLSYLYKYFTNTKFRRGLANSSYVPLNGNSPMQYLFNPGEQVHEIVTSEGRVFTMISFTDYINSSLNMDNLKDMGPSLTLPNGWQYRTRVIDKQIVIKTSAPSYDFVTMFDEFSNYYVESK